MLRPLFWSVSFVLTLTPTVNGQPVPPGPGPVEMTLPDQFNRTHRLSALRGKVVVLVYADRAGADASKELGQKLHVTFHPTARGKTGAASQKEPVRPVAGASSATPGPDVRVIPVACTGSIPGFLHGFVRGQFASAVPDVPIWLDMEGKMAKQFGQAAGVANVVVIDTQGRWRHGGRGPTTVADYERLERVIEALRLEATQK